MPKFCRLKRNCIAAQIKMDFRCSLQLCVCAICKTVCNMECFEIVHCIGLNRNHGENHFKFEKKTNSNKLEVKKRKCSYNGPVTVHHTINQTSLR